MNEEFTVHILSEEGVEKANGIASVFDTTLNHLKQYCPEGRSFSIAKTSLETSCFHAKKAMANDPANWLTQKAA